jgi:hypothetical protein
MMKRIFSGALLLAVTGSMAFATELYHDQMNSGAGWGVNPQGNVSTTFAYNYSLLGIPEAPNSQLGDTPTTGFKAEANLDPNAPVASVLSAYPVGQNFTGTYTLQFDAWMNYEWGVGSTTEFLGGGVGYNGTSADVNSGAQVIVTGDGGSASDYRALKDGFFVAGADMTAGTRQGSDPYYADFFPAVTLPDEEGQDGAAMSTAGSPGFQWVTWVFTNVNGHVTLDLVKPDNSSLRIVNINCNDTSDGSSGCTSDGNIALSYADFFTSVNESGFNFGLFDNVIVSDVPEPASLSLLSLGVLALIRRR